MLSLQKNKGTDRRLSRPIFAMIAFYIITLMIMPVTFIGFGLLWQNHPPKDINSLYGYRTRRSSLSMETWVFAHKYFGKIWIVCGAVSSALAAAAVVLYFFISEDAFLKLDLYVLFIQLAMLIVPIFATEKALKKRFDDMGRALGNQSDSDK